MILRFSVKNHLSFRDTAEVSFIATNLKDDPSGLINADAAGPNKTVVPAAIVYGANAAGKSNVIAALGLMQSMVINSHSSAGPDDELPYRPFALSPTTRKEPTAFTLDFITNGTRYLFSYEYDAKAINYEALISFPFGRPQILYERNFSEYRFGRKLRGQNQIISQLTRPNSLFISAAIQNDHDELTQVYRFIAGMIFNTSVAISASMAPNKSDEIDPRAIRFLTAIETGVVDFRLEVVPWPEENKEFAIAVRKLITDHFHQNDDSVELPSDSLRLQLGHRSADGETIFLDFARESAGTRRLLFLMSLIFRALDRGGVVIVDELDASLHTQAFELIIAMFCLSKYNHSGAQLLATVHDTNILQSSLIRRDQVWFAEKDLYGATSLYALSDIKLRSTDNFEKGYLQGRFGAVPFTDGVESILDMIEPNRAR